MNYSEAQFDHLTSEYSSGDSLVDPAQIKHLIQRSDQEFETLEMAGGEFANF